MIDFDVDEYAEVPYVTEAEAGHPTRALRQLLTQRYVKAALDPDDEWTFVQAAKGGDEAAWITLIRQYSPAIRRAIDGAWSQGWGRWFARRTSTDDRYGYALLGFVLAVNAADGPGKLVQTVPTYLKATANQKMASDASVLAIPLRTVSRYLRIMRDAGWDIDVAMQAAPAAGMSADLLLRIYRSQVRVLPPRGIDPDKPAAEYDPDDWYASVEDPPRSDIEAEVSVFENGASQEIDAVSDAARELVERVIDALNDDQRRVIELTYAFDPITEKGTPPTDKQIAAHLGVDVAEVQKLRRQALRRLRRAAKQAIATQAENEGSTK